MHQESDQIQGQRGSVGMTASSPFDQARGKSEPVHTAQDLVIADAGWFTTANLFGETPDDRANTLLLRCADFRVAWSQGQRPPSWNPPPSLVGSGVWRQSLVLPTGWMKSYPRFGMRPIAHAVRRWRKRVAVEGKPRPLTLVITYPYYLHLARMLRPDRLVYLNIDDYRLYWPRSAQQVERIEREAVRQADLTVCTARYRVDALQTENPEFASRIKHLPHGAPSSSIPTSPQHKPGDGPADIQALPRPWIGYVGTLEDRVDWATLDQVAEANPDASLILVGRVGPDGSDPWQATRRQCLGRPNVHAIGWRDQTIIDTYNRSFDVGLIPYATDHPFNIACCPTKIMDYMAAGRPVVATDLPECRLHADVFDVVPPGQYAEAVSHRLTSGPDDGRASERWNRARANSCRAVVERLLDWIEGD